MPPTPAWPGRTFMPCEFLSRPRLGLWSSCWEGGTSRYQRCVDSLLNGKFFARQNCLACPIRRSAVFASSWIKSPRGPKEAVTPESFTDLRFVKQLDDRGFVQGLYPRGNFFAARLIRQFLARLFLSSDRRRFDAVFSIGGDAISFSLTRAPRAPRSDRARR
jgi:hypothetical protein